MLRSAVRCCHHSSLDATVQSQTSTAFRRLYICSKNRGSFLLQHLRHAPPAYTSLAEPVCNMQDMLCETGIKACLPLADCK